MGRTHRRLEEAERLEASVSCWRAGTALSPPSAPPRLELGPARDSRPRAAVGRDDEAPQLLKVVAVSELRRVELHLNEPPGCAADCALLGPHSPVTCALEALAKLGERCANARSIRSRSR